MEWENMTVTYTEGIVGPTRGTTAHVTGGFLEAEEFLPKTKCLKVGNPLHLLNVQTLSRQLSQCSFGKHRQTFELSEGNKVGVSVTSEFLIYYIFFSN